MLMKRTPSVALKSVVKYGRVIPAHEILISHLPPRLGESFCMAGSSGGVVTLTVHTPIFVNSFTLQYVLRHRFENNATTSDDIEDVEINRTHERPQERVRMSKQAMHTVFNRIIHSHKENAPSHPSPFHHSFSNKNNVTSHWSSEFTAAPRTFSVVGWVHDPSQYIHTVGTNDSYHLGVFHFNAVERRNYEK